MARAGSQARPQAGSRRTPWTGRRAALLLSLLLAVPAALLPAYGGAATIQVTTTSDGTNTADCASGGPSCSLRAAILYANQNGQADTIQVPPGTYQLALADQGSGEEDGGQTGDLDVSDDLTLEGLGAGAGEVVITAGPISGQGHGSRVLEVLSGKVTLRKLTLADGRLDGEGGGVLRNDGDLTLDGVVVRNGQAPTGGGILNTGTLRIQGASVVEANTATGSMAQGGGGGIRNEGRGLSLAQLTVVNSTIRDNRAQVLDANGDPVANQGGSGGGIYNTYGSVAVDQSLIENNSAVFNGGGIAHVRGGLVVTRSVIRGNSSGQLGGGLDTTAPADVSQSAIVGNDAAFGGGGAAVESPGQGSLGVVNSTLSGNTAGEGSALRNSGTLNLTNSTVFDNPAGTAAQIFTCGTQKSDPPNDECAGGAYDTDASGQIRLLVRTALVNTIIGNTANPPEANCNPNPALASGPTLRLNDSLGHNLEVNGSTCADQQSDLAGILPSQPLFVASTLPPGDRHDQLLFALDAASPAKDAGDNGYCPSVDQRGVVRDKAADPCDIGAYEIAAAGAPSTNLVDLVTHIPAQEVKQLAVPGGTQVAFDVTVTNKGPSDAVGVSLTVTLPLTVDLATTPVEAAGKGSCAPITAGEPSFRCDLGTIPALAERRVRVTILPSQTGDVLVTADAQPADKGTETFNPDNTASYTIT
ncbi:MAG: CSLREA domain-containing protein, partial [Gammaproteobacteria bacterium]